MRTRERLVATPVDQHQDEAHDEVFHLPMIIADVAISEANVDNDFSIESDFQHTLSSLPG
jgi:hypothetical protein